MEGNANLELSISGMTCGSCVRHVAEALRGLEGVEEAQVDLGAGRATVAYDPASATAEGMVRAVEEAGYRAAVASAPAPAGPTPHGGCGCGCASRA